MAAFTAKASGNWSAAGQTTWNEVGVPGNGDTASIGAFTVTVDVNTTIGTSPNDATTKVVDKTSATGSLIVATGVTLTIKGNRGGVNSAVFQQEAGSTVTFDNSGSGGSPVYTDVNAGFQGYVFNGTSGNRAVIQAISGQTFKFNPSWIVFTATFLTIRRHAAHTISGVAGNITSSDVLMDTCGYFQIASTGTTLNFILDRWEFLSGTDAANDFKFTDTEIYSSGTRRIRNCIFDKTVTYVSRVFEVDGNFFGSSFEAVAGCTYAHPPRHNFIAATASPALGNGILWTGSAVRNYYVIAQATGNPHFLGPTALLGADNIQSQSVFESQSPDLTDFGDCILLLATCCSGGNKIVAKNCIVVPSGVDVGSGTLVTAYNADAAALFEAYRNTCNVNNTVTGISPTRPAVAVAEANTGTAGHVAAVKSNVVWGSSASQGYVAERQTGNVKDIITAAGVDKNWVYNTSAGDNGRGYNDLAAANTLWTAGDAAAAGVDANQGTGDPLFVDSARNVAKWCLARGYGAQTYAAGKAALRADVTRIKDLLDYVFEGYKVQNASMRNAAHDGGVAGAANFNDTTRSLANITSLRTYFSDKYGIAA